MLIGMSGCRYLYMGHLAMQLMQVVSPLIFMSVKLIIIIHTKHWLLLSLYILFAGTNDNVNVHTSNKWSPVVRSTILVLAGHESLWNNEA